MTTSVSPTRAASSSPRFNKLKRVLEELFQFDQADLDFGIYRIMNAKRGELTRFLDDDLLPQVQTELSKLAGGNRTELERDLAKLIANREAAGVPDTENVPKVKKLRAKLGVTADLSAVEADIYNDLAGFFRRYYQNSDFLSLRRYKKRCLRHSLRGRTSVREMPFGTPREKRQNSNADRFYSSVVPTMHS